MKNINTIKQYLGAFVYDVPNAIKTSGHSDLQCGKIPWVNMCNRDQSLIQNPDGVGVQCDWVWTSDLYLPKIFPIYGRWLYRRTLKDFPVRFKDRPSSEATIDPQVSFIIGHRGEERLPLLLTTIKSIAAQVGCRFECIVVEQDNKQVVKHQLPDWVRYIHTPLPEEDMPYSRSWSFNVGAQAASADFLIFHDNDLLVPDIYSKELLNHFESGNEVINLKRFIFYLDRESTYELCKNRAKNIQPGVDSIMQNAEGGGTIGISRNAFKDIGGFDEQFVGWGGEDNEFWERANTRKVYPYGYLPIVHLWHEAQPERYKSDSLGLLKYRMLKNTSPEERIKELRRRRSSIYRSL